jgi:hypothetical protein
VGRGGVGEDKRLFFRTFTYFTTSTMTSTDFQGRVVIGAHPSDTSTYGTGTLSIADTLTVPTIDGGAGALAIGSTGDVVVKSQLTISDTGIIVAGDLTVSGSTTTIDTQNLVVEDQNIIIGSVATPSNVTANGGGITLKAAEDRTILWSSATDTWDFNSTGLTFGTGSALATFAANGSQNMELSANGSTFTIRDTDTESSVKFIAPSLESDALNATGATLALSQGGNAKLNLTASSVESTVDFTAGANTVTAGGFNSGTGNLDLQYEGTSKATLSDTAFTLADGLVNSTNDGMTLQSQSSDTGKITLTDGAAVIGTLGQSTAITAHGPLTINGTLTVTGGISSGGETVTLTGTTPVVLSSLASTGTYMLCVNGDAGGPSAIFFLSSSIVAQAGHVVRLTSSPDAAGEYLIMEWPANSAPTIRLSAAGTPDVTISRASD